MKTACCLSIWLVLVSLISHVAHADEADARKIVRRSKAATAIMVTESQQATAFCIHAEGWFVSQLQGNDRPRKGSSATLVLSPNEAKERAVDATVMRVDGQTGLVLLRADDGEFPYLPLGADADLFETMQVTTLGFPANSPQGDEHEYPNISLMTGRITTLHKVDGHIERIQLDQLPVLGSSGGPVIDSTGHVVGVVLGGVARRTASLALPVSVLRDLIAPPMISLAAPEIDEENIREEATFVIGLSSVDRPPADRKVELEISARGEKPRRFKAQADQDGRYVVNLAPVSKPRSPDWLRVEAGFAEGALTCRVEDVEIKVGDDSIPLSTVRRIELHDEGHKIVQDGKVRQGKISGLSRIKVDLGGTTARVDLGKATRLTITPIAQPLPEVSYRVLVSDGNQLVAETAGSLVIRAAAGNRTVVAAANPAQVFELTPPKLPDGKKVVVLPAAIDDVVAGGGGRFLILHLKAVQQLAVFDVSRAKVVKYISLPSNDISYTAGASKLFLGFRESKIIQRWDLSTLERELTVSAPEGGIGTLAIGASATTPLILLASANAKRSYLVDPITLESKPWQWQGWKGGAWGPVYLHASYDGSTAVACGGGWAGIEVASLADGKIASSHHGSYVHGDTLIAGNGALVFPNKGGILRRDLASTVKGIEGSPFPAIDPNYSLAYETRGGKPTLTLLCNNDPSRLADIGDLPELEVKSSLPIHKRVQLIPRAGVLITVGEGNNRLMMRPFDLEQALADSDIDYLFVESAPPTQVGRGDEYEYAIRVRSRAGGVEYSLQSGPDGLELLKGGVLSWKVPPAFPKDQSTVIVQISDVSGRTIFHSFHLSIR